VAEDRVLRIGVFGPAVGHRYVSSMVASCGPECQLCGIPGFARRSSNAWLAAGRARERFGERVETVAGDVRSLADNRRRSRASARCIRLSVTPNLDFNASLLDLPTIASTPPSKKSSVSM